MDSTHTHTTQDAMANQIVAADRLKRAEAEVRLAAIRVDALVADASLRYQVHAMARYRDALAARDGAQAAVDAAQDVDCPEAA